MENDNGMKKMVDEVFESLPAGCLLARDEGEIFALKMNVLPEIDLTQEQIKMARKGKQPYLFLLQRATCSTCELIDCPHYTQFQKDLKRGCEEFLKKG